MIALPEWNESAINTTPEKVAAFYGVWPISSGRNVMVKKYRKVEKRLCLCGQRLKPGYGICCRCINETAKTPTQREIRKEMTRRKNGRPCKGCGVHFSSKDRSYCSNGCRKSASVPITHTKCGTCGKDVAKKNHKGSSVLFCGRRCQMVHAAKSVNAKRRDWIAKSLKAKKRYRSRSSKARRESSVKHAFLVAIESKHSSIIAMSSKVDASEGWGSAIAARLVGHFRRASTGDSELKKTSVYAELSRIDSKAKWQTKSVWMKKLNNKFSNAVKRLKKKGLYCEQKRESCCGVEKDRGEPIQMCFVWVGD